jgi:hypothetical protein
MKHKFKTGDLVMIQYDSLGLIAIELGIILSFPGLPSMYGGCARVRIVSYLGSKPNSDPSTHGKNGREKVFPISYLAIATTDTIDNFLVTHGFK